MKLSETAQKVYKILENSEKSRNSDNVLIANFIHQHYHQLLTKDSNGDWCITIKNFERLPSFENIRRSRQKVQNDHKMFPPTDKAVVKARRMKEEEMSGELQQVDQYVWQEVIREDGSRAMKRVKVHAK